MPTSNWSNKKEEHGAYCKQVAKVVETQPANDRYLLALQYIEGSAAFMDAERHSKYALVLSQAAQDPVLFQPHSPPARKT